MLDKEVLKHTPIKKGNFYYNGSSLKRTIV